MFFKRKTKKRAGAKPKTLVFVDFEHWYISLDKQFHQKPDIRAWKNKLSEEFDVDEIYFFADFSNQYIQNEVPKIREVTNFIIETGSKSQFHKKDFTDFIMLDRIYLTAFDRDDIDLYIIFSGDGHFSSVVRFLVTKKHADVGIYGIKDSVSHQLRSSATWVRELPSADDLMKAYYRAILGNLNYLENDIKNGKIHHPTFKATVEAVTKHYRMDYASVRLALQELIDNSYIKQTEVLLGNNSIRELVVDWNKVISDGIWSENKY